MASKTIVLGYHGCDRSTALKVVSGQEELKPSKNPYDWLGDGVYFWEDSCSRAIKWAKDDCSGKIKTPAVLGAMIDPGNCLNLIDAEHLSIVKAAHTAYINLCETSGLSPLANKGKDLRARFLDRAVMQTLHGLREKDKSPSFDTVRAFFVEGEPLYETSGLRSLDHVQMCVRNLECIVGYFLPRLK
jgi:hypothetical protein